jgi:hypothetical protein
MQVIQIAMVRYLFFERSLRKAAGGIVLCESIALHHSTLWHWLDGLGEKALDRSDEIKNHYPPTTSAALTESSRRAGIDLCTHFTASDAAISPSKYQSQRRKDQLQADMRLFIVAAILFADHPNDSLERWNEFLLPLFDVTVWDFPTAKIKTSIQQARPP